MKRIQILLSAASLFAAVLYGGMSIRTPSVTPSSVMTIEDIRMDANRMSGILTNNGIWFYDYSAGNWGLEWPKGSGLSPIFAGGQWISAKVEGDVRVACVIHFNSEFQPGEIINDVPSDPMDSKYRWYVIQPGGIGDWDTWPSDQGAPLDADNKPLLTGDRTAFSVWNDTGTHSKFATEKLGAEIRQLVWQFNSEDALGDMTFLKWQIINKSDKDWDSTFFSIWLDPDLGGALDDLVGCDSDLGLGYCYNSTNTDQNYGSAPPAVGIDFFQGPVIDENGSTVTLPDGTMLQNKKILKMTAFIYYSNDDSNQGEPKIGQDAWNYQRGYWQDNSPILDPDGNKSPFMFDGDPVVGTGWLDSNAFDRRFLMTTGPFTMPKWEDSNSNGKVDFGEPGVQEIVAGVIAARGSSNLNSVTELKIADMIAQEAYNVSGLQDVETARKVLPGGTLLEGNYPNPFNPSTTIRFKLQKRSHVRLEVYNLTGRKVAELMNETLEAGAHTANWNAQGMASGVYVYCLHTKNSLETKKAILLK